MTCRLPLERQIVLLGRVRRALHAWVHKRISVDTFDAIMARVNKEIGL